MSAGLRTVPRLIRLRVRRPVVVILALLLVGLAALAPGRWGTPTAVAATPTFSFGVAGDFGQTDSSTGAVLNAVKSSGASMMFGIGDFSYVAGSSEPSWCSYVKARVGSTYPFELLAGNHESYPRDGYYVNYNSCLPDHLGGVSGSYGQEYYVDYPATAPLVRFVMISPNLPYGSSSATRAGRTSPGRRTTPGPRTPSRAARPRACGWSRGCTSTAPRWSTTPAWSAATS